LPFSLFLFRTEINYFASETRYFKGNACNIAR
jgi:hypothetical protein